MGVKAIAIYYSYTMISPVVMLECDGRSPNFNLSAYLKEQCCDEFIPNTCPNNR